MDRYVRAVRNSLARQLPAQPMQNLPPAGDGGLDRGYWHSYTPVVRRNVPTMRGMNRPLFEVPTASGGPPSAPPATPAWINTNCPPWVCPPFWSQSVETTATGCAPTYEQSILLAPTITVPQDYMLIVKGISYEALNAELYDVFQIDFFIDGSLRMSIEDMLIDTAPANQALRYGLAGHTRPMPTHLVVDRNHTLSIRTTLRGPINFQGNSPYFPGQPITTGDCSMKVILQGWMANLRENWDGAPRPTDLGSAASFEG